jgi:NAD-dependent oxidoreductase involved in siderophore biosynthesis
MRRSTGVRKVKCNSELLFPAMHNGNPRQRAWRARLEHASEEMGWAVLRALKDTARQLAPVRVSQRVELLSAAPSWRQLVQRSGGGCEMRS